MDRLEEELTCAICYDIFQDPRVLSCSHTFCRECLQGLLQPSPGEAVSCPSCRARVAIPAAGPQALPTNFALKAVIDKCQREEPAGAGVGKGTRTRRKTKPKPEAGTCQAHPQQPLNIYCLRDKRLVCGQCLTVGEHRGHPIDDLRSACRRGREAWGKLLGQLAEKSQVSLCASRLQEHKARCQSALESDREAVLKYFNQLFVALENKKAAVLSALDELDGSISRKYDPLIEEVEKLKLEESELKKLHSAIQKEESPLLFLEKLDGLQQRLRALQQKRLPDTEPVEVHPRMENLIKHKWPSTAISQVHKLPTPQLQLIRRGQCSQEFRFWEPNPEPADLPGRSGRSTAFMILGFAVWMVLLSRLLLAILPAPLAALWKFLLGF